MMMNSIRYKVTAITIIEILLAILCVYLASFTIIQSENDRRSVEMMDLLAQDTSKSFEEYATGIARSVDMVANLTADSLDSATLSRCGAIGAQSDPDQRTPEQTAERGFGIILFVFRAVIFMHVIHPYSAF